jgi:hypothetical protein
MRAVPLPARWYQKDHVGSSYPDGQSAVRRPRAGTRPPDDRSLPPSGNPRRTGSATPLSAGDAERTWPGPGGSPRGRVRGPAGKDGSGAAGRPPRRSVLRPVRGSQARSRLEPPPGRTHVPTGGGAGSGKRLLSILVSLTGGVAPALSARLAPAVRHRPQGAAWSSRSADHSSLACRSSTSRTWRSFGRGRSDGAGPGMAPGRRARVHRAPVLLQRRAAGMGPVVAAK